MQVLDVTTLANKRYRTYSDSVATGNDVWYWDEWRIFAEKLGIVLEPRTTSITIRLDIDKPVRITQEYMGT